MGLNTEIQDQYFRMDEHNMMLVNSDDRSWRDSIGRNFLFLMAYLKDSNSAKLIEGLMSCYKDGVLIRHPSYPDEQMSKDHWSYFIMYKRLCSIDREFREFVDNVPRITGLYNWMYALAGSKYDELGYYLVQIPGAVLGNIAHTLGGIHKNRKLIVPPYSLHNKAWQIYFLRDSWAKRVLKKILLRRVKKHDNTNYLLRLLFGDYVTKAEVESYKSLTGYRWGVFLDWSNDRDVKEIAPELVKYNAYDKDLLMRVYDEFKEDN